MPDNNNNSAIGIFPQIMVRALVIMMVRDDMLDHTPPLYSLWSSFNYFARLVFPKRSLD